MLWNYTPTLWPYFITVVFLLALSTYSGRRHHVPGALPFTIGCLFTAIWSAGTAMAVAAVDIPAKIFWIKFESIWPLPAMTAITCFILEYSWPGRGLTRRNLALLSVVPLLDAALILTNDLHHLAWRSFASEGLVIPLPGPAAWFLTAYAFGLGIVNLVVLAWLFLRSPQNRWPAAIMITGQIAARTIYLLDAANILHSDLPLEILTIGFLFLMYAVVLYGFHLFDPIPLARQTVIEQMHAGMLVLDPRDRVASLNPSAERILGAPASQIRGRPVRELLPAYPAGYFSVPAGTEVELSLGTGQKVSGQDARHYTMAISQLNDWRGLEVGRLLILHDVTAQKQAQAQIVEQQRALATLNERERLARELHDSLGQVLGYASFQVEAAAKLSRDGQGDAAAIQLDRLGSVIRDAHADVREYILNLRSAPALQQPFFTTLQQYLEGFTNNYNIQTHLMIGPGLDDQKYSPEAQLQVWRIIQEALSNARRHGRAHHVDVKFAQEDGRVCMTIEDDGAGFDSAQSIAGENHFGLRFMRERAEQLGGSLQLQSAPGTGTRVVVEVPIPGDDPIVCEEEANDA